MFPDTRYLLIEPLEEYRPLFEQVKQSWPSVEFTIAAASAHEGDLAINVHPDLVGSSLYREIETGTGVNGVARTVRSLTVDRLVREAGAGGPYLLKVDVQGAELDVLTGAECTLRDTELVILEVSFFKFFEDGPECVDILAYMKARGFVPYDIVGRQYRPLDRALSQADIAFVKEDGIFRRHHCYATAEQRDAQNQQMRRYLDKVCSPAIVMTERRPTISIVTPSFNQVQFLEEAMQSVLGQTYPHVEYVVIDGGSSDGSATIIRRYADRLAYWVSEPDQGQYDAINKGFARTTGDIMAWLNSDDKYTPWTLSVVAEIFSSFPEIEWLTSVHPVSWNQHGQAVAVDFTGGFSRHAFVRGGNFPAKGLLRAAVDPTGVDVLATVALGSRRSPGGRWLRMAADFELWARFYDHAELFGVQAVLGGFRSHGAQKSVLYRERYMDEAEQVAA